MRRFVKFALVKRRGGGVGQSDEFAEGEFLLKEGNLRIGVNDQHIPAADASDRQPLTVNRDDSIFFVEDCHT